MRNPVVGGSQEAAVPQTQHRLGGNLLPMQPPTSRGPTSRVTCLACFLRRNPMHQDELRDLASTVSCHSQFHSAPAGTASSQVTTPSHMFINSLAITARGTFLGGS